MFKLTVNTDNDAFRDSDADHGNPALDNYARNQEVARILREAARRLENGQDYGPVIDVSGSTVGAWGYVRDDS